MKENGFTLIEVLVSIVIFSFLIGLAAYSFRFYIGIIGKIQDSYPERARNLSLLGETIRSMFWFVGEKKALLDKDRFFVYFYGKPDSMLFITGKPIDISNNLAVCKLFIDNNNLILQESPVYFKYNNYKNPCIVNDFKKDLIILKNVDRIELAYFSKGKEIRNLEGNIPSLVKMSLIFKDKKEMVVYFKIKSNFYNKKALSRIMYETEQ